MSGSSHDAGGPGGDLSPEEQMLFALADRPAYLRRADAVDSERRRLTLKLTADRKQLLFHVRLALKTWNRLLTEHPSLASQYSEAAHAAVAWLNEAAFEPSERITTVTSAGWRLWAPRKWSTLCTAIRDFNVKWSRYLSKVDLSPANNVISLYNRYYVFEKECLLRSARLASLGFSPLADLTVNELEVEFPPLKMPPDQFTA